VAAVVVVGCSLIPQLASGPAASPIASASGAAMVDQLGRGHELFLANCSRCHGDDGQGDIGPAVIGERHGLRGYGTAQGLFDYVSRTMPFDAAGSLSEQAYWDVLAYILTENGYLAEGTELGPENAADVDISS
jgi:mono/diheme cytochrome c family protein